MITQFKIVTILIFAAVVPAAVAQAPAGRGRGAGGPPALSATQQLALLQMSIPDSVVAAQATAQAALVQASFANPSNAAGIESAAKELAAADLALAVARADAFDQVQRSLQAITPAQASSYFGGAGRGGGRGGAASWQSAYADHTGYASLFDGKTLDGWEGEAGYWDVQDGTIHRHQTVEPKNFYDFGQNHVHYVGGPGKPDPVFADFDLKVEFKIRAGNAGIQYRSRLESALHKKDGEPARAAETGRGGGGGDANIPLRNVAAAIADPLGKPLPANIRTLDDAYKAGLLPQGPLYGNGTGDPWQVSGYQYDIYPTGTGNTGSLYEGQGRGVSANSGEVVQFHPDGTRTIIGKAADLPGQYLKEQDWNSAEIICRGNTMIHLLNGHVIMVATDDDTQRRALKGIISLQLESPSDVEVWYRNVWIKTL